MTDQRFLAIYEPCELDLKDLFTSDQFLTFLVGAGISIEPPSGLMPAWQIMEAILRFGAVEEAVPKLLGIKDLRFEYLIELFRNYYDNELKFLKYFDEATQPNIIHQFLAHQILAGQLVMTTNFDSLIERAIGLDDPALRVVITRKDFEQFGDPQKNLNKGLLAVYKLHGSLTNAKTGEDTRESVIITLDALGTHKEGELFSVETFKRNLFMKVGQGRTIVVMGYSGGDDFDIIPTLFQMKGLKRVIWMAHIDQPGSDVKCYRLRPREMLRMNEINELSREDEILRTMGRLGVKDVVKVYCHTASFIAGMMGSSRTPEKGVHDAYTWLRENFPPPIEGRPEEYAARVFDSYGFYNEALKYHQEALEINKSGDPLRVALSLGHIGLVYVDREPQKALDCFQKSYEIYERLDNKEGMARQLGNIGLIHMDIGEPLKALEYYQKAYEIEERLGDLTGVARQLCNIGLVYMDLGELENALDYLENSYAAYEQAGDLAGMATTLGNTGLIYMDMGKSRKALKYHQRSYEIEETLGKLSGMAADLGNIGLIYMDMGKSQKALEHFQKSYEIEDRLENHAGKAIALSNIALLYLQTEKLEKSLEYYQKAYDIFKRLGYQREMENVSRSTQHIQKLLTENSK
ncbi:MAG: tetratricopeptide repeat protein [Promethearchaeota archaeon]